MTGLWTASAAAAATGGTAHQAWTATGASIDSRTIEPGDLFIAIRGPNTDGHLHVKDALAKGAVAAMVAADWTPDDDGMKLLTVADTMDGLNALARTARGRSGARVAAITGSVGKTSTKEALAHILSRQGLTEATRGNLNNHWGLPLSLARLPAAAQYGVFELGMNHTGELTPLSRLLRPDIAIITTVESVHLEFFASEEAIADAKAEIFAGMDGDGAALLNADNRHFERLKHRAQEAGVGRVYATGTGEDTDFRLLDWRVADGGNDIEANIDGQRLRLRTDAPGLHWAMIALTVLGAARLMGADVEQAAASLAGMAPPKGRGAQHRITLPGGGSAAVIDETYNASPASMRAAIAVLGATAPGPGGRRIAVLGDMLELGEDSAELHAALADDLEACSIDLVFAAGPHMARLMDRLPASMRGLHAAASDGLIGPVTAAAGPGDVITVKGSLGSRMAPVLAALLALEQHNNSGPAQRNRAVRAAGTG